MSNAFAKCTNITSIPLLNTSKVTNISSTFLECSNLIELPLFDFSSVTNIQTSFNNCNKLIRIPSYNFSNVTNTVFAFDGCGALKEFLPTGLKVSFDLSKSRQFKRTNLVTVLNNLGTPSTTQTLTIGSTNLAKLTEEDIAIATQKNWTLK